MTHALVGYMVHKRRYTPAGVRFQALVLVQIPNRSGQVFIENVYYSYKIAMTTMNVDITGERKNNIKNNTGNSSKQTSVWPLFEIQGAQSSSQNHRSPKPFLESNKAFKSRGNIENNETFHQAIGPILAVAQLFGILPLTGLRKSSPQKLSYALVSPRTSYTLVITICLLVMAITAFIHMVRTFGTESFEVRGGIGAATAGAVFYTNSLLSTIIFLRLAPRWPSLQKKWRIMECQLDSCKQSCLLRLRWKFRIIVIMVMIPALLEHIASLVTNMPSRQLLSNNNITNATWKDYLEFYTYSSHAFILSSYNYSVTLGVFLFIISKVATFTWNFTDLFVMLVATGLAERYKKLNKSLLNFTTLELSSLDWSSFRKNYAALSTLVKQTDDNISSIILLSFVNNLYFICLQLLNGLSHNDAGTISSIYFLGSFIFLVGRTVAVTLLVARINDQSKLALPALYNCPALNYNIESQRLQFQITSDDVALTGLKFFSITRNFMLAVAGAIVTYEVVLLQFNVAMNK